MAKLYDATMRKIEAACLANWRRELLSEVEGDVLEVGSGTGVNLPYYPRSIKSLVLTEPDSHMLKILRKKVAENHDGNFRIDNFQADSLAIPERSFNAVVSTLVLCSVRSQEETLREILRILKPGGKLFFIEHVLAKENPHLIKWQKFFEPLWKLMGGNCHLTRDTEMAISKAGFTFDRIERGLSSGGLSIVSPTIKGIASKMVA